MAYREVPRMEIGEVIRRWQAGHSRRQIAASTGLSRDTVAKYLAAAVSQGIAQEGPVPSEDQLSRLAAMGRVGPRQAAKPSDDLLEPWADQIYQWITADRLQMTRIHELLAGRGCGVTYQSLRRFIIKRSWSKPSKTTVRMEDTPPGEVAEADFGRLGLIGDRGTGRRKLVWAMLIVLCHSRHCFLWPMHFQKLPDVIAGLEAAWTFFGRMPKYLVVDNFPAAVAGTDPLHPRLSRGFLEYAQHRGFFVDPARVRHPKDKPRVERGVPYARERFFKGASFDGLAHIRAEAPRWCLQVAAGASTAPPAANPSWSSRRRSVMPCSPGTACPMRSPVGARSRCIRTITSSAGWPSTRFPRPPARRDRRWRSGWTASWCGSTTRDGCSRSTSASPRAAGPPTPAIIPTRSPGTPPGCRTTSRARRRSWGRRWMNSPSASWAARCHGPGFVRDTSCSAWESATRPSVSTPPAVGHWRWTSSTSAAWNVSWCRPWKRRLCPSCSCPSRLRLRPC